MELVDVGQMPRAELQGDGERDRLDDRRPEATTTATMWTTSDTSLAGHGERRHGLAALRRSGQVAHRLLVHADRLLEARLRARRR